MATSLLTLFDDIATILDDVAAMTKIATKKTAGVLGDDLALNANQVAGVKADRELPVVWAVFKGSALNKFILVPVALLISQFAPWAITPLLMLGGLYLCYEGVHKLSHKFLHPKAAEAEKAKLRRHVADGSVDIRAAEREKIKGAIRTDFILSAEIIVIALGSVEPGASFAVRVGVLVAIAALMTFGVYGLVAAIVKLDDVGLWLTGRPALDTAAPDGAAVTPGATATRAADVHARVEERSGAARALGRAILWFAPVLMKVLSVVGTAAMFIVGGGILTHGVHWIAERIESAAHTVASVPGVGTVLQSVTKMLLDSLVGIAAGAVALAVVMLVQKLRGGGAEGAATGGEHA